MYTGVGDISKLGRIKAWKKRSTIKTWHNKKDGSTSVCNMINGSDSTVYPPFLKPEGYLESFQTDVCR